MRPLTYITVCALLLCTASLAAFLSARSNAGAPVLASHPAMTDRPVSPSTTNAWTDTDGDGFPDKAELTAYTDRENFRRWFTRIAEGQFYRMSDEWNTEQRDCAGLVRFSLREALRRHDRLWLRRAGAEYESLAPDVRRYTLETSPLGEKLFRTRAGLFTEANLADATFSEFADARTLREVNSEFISRDSREAQAGDLIFFHQPWGARFPFHVMIFLGGAQVSEDDAGGANDWVVYHTGASPTDAGTVKKIRLATLARHPDARWRPVASNPRFLGFYRLKILQ